MSWYYQVMRDEKPAKFLICKKISCSLDPKASSIEELWREHVHLSNLFKDVHRRVAVEGLKLDEVEASEPSFLDLKAELLQRILAKCILCEWRCEVDRIGGVKKGACKLGLESRVSTWFLHHGEENPLVCTGGSGTIFFTGCTFRCVFCQNWDISQNPSDGAAVDGGRLASFMKSLRQDGAHNINFVGGEPTMHLHTIIDGMNQLDVNVPMLWNSNMYCSLEAMKVLADVIDIWLPDFKYGSDTCALKLSMAVNYFPIVARNHRIAHQSGDMIIRHLVLPNHIECCTKPILQWIAENCPRSLVNIMGQYHPDNIVPRRPEKYCEITRRPTSEEMGRAYGYADDLGVIYAPVS